MTGRGTPASLTALRNAGLRHHATVRRMFSVGPGSPAREGRSLRRRPLSLPGDSRRLWSVELLLSAAPLSCYVHLPIIIDGIVRLSRNSAQSRAISYKKTVLHPLFPRLYGKLARQGALWILP